MYLLLSERTGFRWESNPYCIFFSIPIVHTSSLYTRFADVGPIFLPGKVRSRHTRIHRVHTNFMCEHPEGLIVCADSQ